MPDSLFMRRPPRRGRLVLMILGSLLIHGGFVLIAAIWPMQQSWKAETPVVDLTLDPIGDPEVRELIVADDQPTPPPDQPTPPPDETPMPDETPPPTEDPEMAQPDETPPPEKPKPKAPKPANTPPPVGAKRGPVAQDGVVGGNPNGTKTTGTPGVKSSVGWSSFQHIPYPPQAKVAHLQGTCSVRLTTNASGGVSNVVVTQSAGSIILDSAAKNYILANGHGPPNSTKDTIVTFRP